MNQPVTRSLLMGIPTETWYIGRVIRRMIDQLSEKMHTKLLSPEICVYTFAIEPENTTSLCYFQTKHIHYYYFPESLSQCSFKRSKSNKRDGKKIEWSSIFISTNVKIHLQSFIHRNINHNNPLQLDNWLNPCKTAHPYCHIKNKYNTHYNYNVLFIRGKK